jgi:integrase/recombinase XerD
MFQKLSRLELLGKEQVFVYLRHGWQMNHKPKSLSGCFKSIELFLVFCAGQGKSRLEEIVREDLEGFVEHEQDRGTQITSTKTRLKHVIGFIRFLADRDLVSERILKRKIKLMLPDILPRAINPDDVRQLLSVIKKIRDRAMILVLLRTGMRIGELLNTKIVDLDFRDRKIHIYEGEKNALGRVVYLSDDALFALKLWLSRRESRNEFIFYGQKENTPICYSTARFLFVRYQKKAGLLNKKYTIHSLRHTFATELLNAGMRLECLQQLMGHHHIEMTRRYARLTDKSREEEYFRAMALIEHGGINGNN